MATHSQTTDARDPKSFRVPSYPTLAPFFVAGFLLLLQVGLFAIGGVSFFGNRINSLFAIGEDDVEISLSQSTYNSDEVEYVNGELRLKEQDLNDLGSEDQLDQLDQVDQLESEKQEEKIGNGESEVRESNDKDSQNGLSGVDGVNEDTQLSQLNQVNQQTQYTSEAQISFPQEIEYSKLVRILELSSVNDFASSQLPPKADQPLAGTAHITYQLSPNNIDWYYYSATEARWEKTTNGYVSSNTVQEINSHIDTFDPEVGEEKSLFIRAYLYSDGKTQVTLKRLVVVRELQLITNTRDQLDPEKEGLSEFTVEKPESLTFIRPVILNAAYANGNKIISGRVELDDGVVIPEAELPNYSVTIYYTPDRDITAPAKDVDEEIGRADLQQITINNEIQYVFELKTPSSPGGYVTAQVCYGQCALGDELNAQRSQLSAPTENATLTVTETGDQSDATPGDGSCDHDGVTPGSQCTLRAAIEEANALAGDDNIYFNIPDTDGNYLDYDNQTPGSNSGDGVGGDDFWTIQPGSAFSNITEGITLDGATQTANQGDTNIEGPEVEIAGTNTNSNGLSFSPSALDSSINSTIINRFHDSSTHYNGVYIRSDNFLITNSYIGVDIKGTKGDDSYRNSYGVYIHSDASNAQIGNGITNGNDISQNLFAVVNYGNASVIDGNTLIDNNFAIYNEADSTIVRNHIGCIGYCEAHILIGGSSPTIQGNIIEDAFQYGVFIEIQNQDSRLNTGDDVYSFPIIGGQASLTGSLCEGLEKNCFYRNGFTAIQGRDTMPANEDTLYHDNTFGDQNGHVYPDNPDNYSFFYKQEWLGLTEILSNGYRRTDLTSNAFESFYPEENAYLYDTYCGPRCGGSISFWNFQFSWANQTVSCLGASCLDQGIANSTGNTAILGVFGFTNYTNVKSFFPWRQMYEYFLVDGGQRVDRSLLKFEERHFVSQEFSFDGDATTHPVIGDSGEAWTDNPVATRDIGTNSFSRYQLMEVEFVDANPIINDNGTSGDASDDYYVITVDGSGNEDNVSTSGYDDGEGSYSGGGNEGPDGLPNGETSLKEAIYVANTFTAANSPTNRVRIKFDLPVDDTSHVCYQDDGVVDQVTSGNIVATTTQDDPTCGGTQIDPDHPYSWFDLSSTGTHTLTDAMIIDGYTQDGSSRNTAEMGQTLNHIIKVDTGDTTFDLDGGDSEITGIVMPEGAASINLNSNNNHIHGFFMGVDVSGLNASGSGHTIVINGSGNTIGSDVDGNNDNAEASIINRAANSTQTIELTLNASNAQIANNYLNTGVTGLETGGTFITDDAISFPGLGAGTISNITVSNNLIVNNNFGIRATGSHETDNFSISDNKFNVSWDESTMLRNHASANSGIHLQTTGTNEVYIEDNIFKHYNGNIAVRIQDGGGLADDSVISNNVVDECARGMYVGNSNPASPANNVTFSGNKFSNYTTGTGTKVSVSYVNNSVFADNYLMTHINNSGVGGTNNRIIRNKICTNETGTNSSNASGGYFYVLGTENVVGGSEGDRNVFGCNLYVGLVSGIDDENFVSHNYFGLSLDGDQAFSDFYGGLLIWHGRVDVTDNNFAGPMSSFGIIFIGTKNNALKSTVARNCIGTRSDCTTPISNEFAGINFFQPTENVDVYDNTITGSTNASSSSIIVNNGSKRINIHDNKVYNNESTGIDLLGGTEDSYRVTENDLGDVDTGNNDLQNYPIITKVEYLGAGQYRISGDLDENSSESPFDIEICESYDHPSGHGGCLQTLGHVTANSPWQTIVTVPGSDGTDGVTFSTLATNTNGSTSEFGETIIADETNPDFSVITYEIELVYPINGIQIDDRTPQLDWNPAVETATGYLDPDIHHYEVYIDGVYYESTIDSTTELQLNSPLSLGTHTWEVVAFRQLGDGSFVETARSTVESFEIINPNYSFEPIYPVDVTIDDTTPLFDWSDLDPSSDFDSYDLYIDGELVQEGIVTSEHQLAQSSQLTADTHTWYVTAMRLEPDGSRTEVGRTDTAEFEIFIPVEPPVTGEESEDEREPEDDDRQSSIFNRIVPILPITGVLTIGFISMLAFGFAGSLNDLFLNLGFLIGIVYRRKKKYWGIVFDEQSSEPIPFAIIRLFKDGRLVKQTVSDLEGRYALIAEEDGTYTIESKANGYQPYTKDISYNDAVDIVEDIPLLKTDQKVFFLKRLINHRKADLIRYLKYGLVGLMVLGFFYTLYVTFRSPHIINFILLGIYALLFFLNALEILRYLSRKSGRVEEIQSKKGVGGVSVRIYQAGKQLDVVLSNVKGVIKFNLKPGIYRFMAHKSGYEQVKGKARTEQRERGRGVKLELDKKGTLSSSIKMRSKRVEGGVQREDETPFGEA